MGLAKCIYRLTILYGFGLRLRCFCSALVASFVLLFSNSALAEDYYWTRSGNIDPFPSAVAVCNSLPNPYGSLPFLGVSYHSGGAGGTCEYGDPSSGTGTYYTLVRGGDSCASGGTYDDVAGGCAAPPENPCTAKQGTSEKIKWTSDTEEPSGSVSNNGCAATVTGFMCGNTTVGQYSCTGTVTYTGDELAPAEGTTSGECTGEACNAGEPQKESTDTPCTVSPAENGYTCSTTKSESNPGKTQCGMQDGAWACSENPKASSSTSQSDIVQTSINNPDGSTTTKTTTTTTTTSCKGVGNCTTGTTTTTTTGGTNPNGTNKPPSNSCTGPECSGGKVGGGSSGSGTGSAGDVDDEEEKPADVVSGDMACTALVSCSGEVIQCAILRQEQQSRCADIKFRDASPEKVAELKTDLDAEFAGAEYQPIKPTAETTFSLEGMIDTSSRFGAACPILPLISYTWIDGNGRNFDPNVPGLCTFLTFLGYLNVAFAMRKAAEIIASGVR